MKEIKIKGLSHYFGGKGGSGTYQKIINHIRPHDVLIIPFLGNCAITRYIKRAAVTTIGIDLSGNIINNWRDTGLDWIQLIKGCGISYLENFRPDPNLKYVIYADPPYPMDSRRSQLSIYENEMSDADHVRLLGAIKRITGTFKNVDVLISTYENKMYRDALTGWQLDKYNSTTRHGNAIEYLYMNYSNGAGLLHDYGFIGRDYRERERIKKKITRWVSRLEDLPASERNAIIMAIEENREKSQDIAPAQVAVPAGNTEKGGRIRKEKKKSRSVASPMADNIVNAGTREKKA